ncbi:MAG: AbrB/MazE/SpoVT family DNA-binding domain-containing protein [Betaproteobacteria bacterium]
MITVSVRKQGGAAIMTIPSEVLKMLNVSVGGELQLQVVDGAFTARPAARKSKPRKRYTLAELLQNVTPEKMTRLAAETEWARAGKPRGRELA